MPDMHVVPDPNPDLGCWAGVTGSPCNKPAVCDVGLCQQHLDAYRRHPSTQDCPEPDTVSWLDRAVHGRTA